MPTLEDIVTNIEGAKYFSTLDAATGFWQIRLDKPSSYLCTMSTPYGRYRFLRMPFGIATAPEVFQRAMHQVLQGLNGVEVVMDDILVWGSTKEEHDRRLQNVLQRCQEVNLKLNLAKCHFFKAEVRYLGFVLTDKGLSIDSNRAEDILAVQVPENAKEQRLQQIKRATNQDENLRTLREYASTKWPEDKNAVPEQIRAYWPYRDEIHSEDDLLFRSNRLIIPSTMKNEVLDLLHAAHGGTEKMKQRARDVMFWPGMSADIQEKAERCALCRQHKPRNQRLPMMSHDVPELPWQTVGMDLFHQAGEEYVIIVDFYSFYFELRRLKHTTADAVIKFCEEVFVTHGLPHKLISDN
ncbi:uncharacterized protein K02A2.6-like, partial [Ixodes scapularis]|uniref:uncharacterized protein K02A2.6-like n=1 Tax=Ixodes scapularis TaxID=6945 RepID=UPI001C394563